VTEFGQCLFLLFQSATKESCSKEFLKQFTAFFALDIKLCLYILQGSYYSQLTQVLHEQIEISLFLNVTELHWWLEWVLKVTLTGNSDASIKNKLMRG
jgi:hypothetical protein